MINKWIKISSDKILLNDLKEILNQQFIIKYNFEKLFFNLVYSVIIYKNDSLIKFYNNQSNSTIFFGTPLHLAFKMNNIIQYFYY